MAPRLYRFPPLKVSEESKREEEELGLCNLEFQDLSKRGFHVRNHCNAGGNRTDFFLRSNPLKLTRMTVDFEDFEKILRIDHAEEESADFDDMLYPTSKFKFHCHVGFSVDTLLSLYQAFCKGSLSKERITMKMDGKLRLPLLKLMGITHEGHKFFVSSKDTKIYREPEGTIKAMMDQDGNETMYAANLIWVYKMLSRDKTLRVRLPHNDYVKRRQCYVEMSLIRSFFRSSETDVDHEVKVHKLEKMSATIDRVECYAWR